MLADVNQTTFNQVCVCMFHAYYHAAFAVDTWQACVWPAAGCLPPLPLTWPPCLILLACRLECGQRRAVCPRHPAP